jgi:hypothetical protein
LSERLQKNCFTIAEGRARAHRSGAGESRQSRKRDVQGRRSAICVDCPA